MALLLTVGDIQLTNARIREYSFDSNVFIPEYQWVGGKLAVCKVYRMGEQYFFLHRNATTGNQVFHYGVGRLNSANRFIQSDDQVQMALNQALIDYQSQYVGAKPKHAVNLPKWVGWSHTQLGSDLHEFVCGDKVVHLYTTKCEVTLPDWVLNFPDYLPIDNSRVFARIDPSIYLDDLGVSCSAVIIKMCPIWLDHMEIKTA